MRAIDITEFQAWCIQRNVTFARDVRGCPTIKLGSASSGLYAPVPQSLSHQAHLLSTLTNCMWLQGFGGAAVFLRECHVWGQEITLRLIERMRLSYGIKSPLQPESAYLFSNDEELDCVTFFAVMMSTSCDAYLVPNDGREFVLTTHDEMMDIVFDSEKDHAELFAWLIEKWDAKLANSI